MPLSGNYVRRQVATEYELPKDIDSRQISIFRARLLLFFLYFVPYSPSHPELKSDELEAIHTEVVRSMLPVGKKYRFDMLSS